ncbi:competence protein CoiA family protein [Cohnella abietis]|uniref:Competence protein CoiA-like N-terminal domain-containing protein n=1 Tax=Cohnella abietis TaxID=2507935 RepID=A0A3T1CY19_9BACL|nr:competence protein CoiA family protein [Cohnella abietis]BBI30728.1 hypothetical protein KCTCHS21_01270 [Cohnella abietis]
MSDLLHFLTRRADGEIVHIDNAEKGEDYFCPECNGAMLFRKGERGLRRPHFAHLQLSDDCTPETMLHRVFKEQLATLIEERILRAEPLLFKWNCSYCKGEHVADLIKSCVRVALEFPMEMTRPDIALFTSDGQVRVVIEVVVTHKPTWQAMYYYEQEGIFVLQIHLESYKDLDKLNESPLPFTKMNLCYNPKCIKCEHHKRRRYMEIITGPCLRCTGEMKMAFMMDGGYTRYVHRFYAKEIETARENGVLIQEHFTQLAYGTSSPLLGCTCGHCGYFIHNGSTLGNYILPAREGEYPSQRIQMGYVCVHCK